MKSVEQELEVSVLLAGRQAKKSILPEKDRESFSVAGLMELFGLSALAGRHPQSLSGGEKQRLVIACAFAKNPDVLILDEPTSGLDGGNMTRMARALELLARRGTCVIVITHDLELMKLSCTSALRLPFFRQERGLCAEQTVREINHDGTHDIR